MRKILIALVLLAGCAGCNSKPHVVLGPTLLCEKDGVKVWFLEYGEGGLRHYVVFTTPAGTVLSEK